MRDSANVARSIASAEAERRDKSALNCKTDWQYKQTVTSSHDGLTPPRPVNASSVFLQLGHDAGIILSLINCIVLSPQPELVLCYMPSCDLILCH